MALLAAAGVSAALANFVAWPVAAGLGALSGAVGVWGGVQLQRRAQRHEREAAWVAALGDRPAGTDAAGGDGVLAQLLPERRLVPYSPLHGSLLRQLLRWAEGRGQIDEPVLYVDGQPGCGKTRLLVEFAAQVPARCGWVLPGRGAAAVAAAAGLGQPVVLLVDDADTRTDLTQLLIARHEAGPATVRVILAARTTVWWPIVRSALPAHVLSAVPYRAQLRVPPIVADGHSQQRHFARALRYFNTEGDALPQATVVPQHPPPSIMLIHAAAALAAQTHHDGVVHPDTVVADLVATERDRWRTTIQQAGLGAVPGAALHQALLLAALVGAADDTAAVRLLAEVPALAGPSAADLRRRIADWLRGWYPHRFPDWLAPHLPASLIEQHAAQTVANDPVVARALVAATVGEDDRARQMLVLLGRAMTHSPAAKAALAVVLNADPHRMTAAAITVTMAYGLPLDQTVAAALTTSGGGLTVDQLWTLYQLIPDDAAVHILAATTVTLLRTILDRDASGQRHRDPLRIRHTLALVLSAQGHHEHAVEQFRAVLATQTQVLGAEHPDTFTTRHNLAGALHDLGHPDKAADQYQSVLTTRTQVLGAQHPDTLGTRHGLASTLHDLGRYEQAADEYRAVLVVQTEVLGAEYPNSLSTRHGLAMVLRDQGRYKQATEEYRAVLAAQIRVLGAEHPATLGTRHNLATVLHDQGHYEPAVEGLETVVNTRTHVLGAGHPDTLATRHNLAGAMCAQGHHERAAEDYEAVLNTRAHVLGAGHPDTLATRHGLAVVLYAQGRYEHAAELFQAVLTIQTQVLGAEHPDTLATRHNLAAVLHDQGHREQALRTAPAKHKSPDQSSDAAAQHLDRD